MAVDEEAVIVEMLAAVASIEVEVEEITGVNTYAVARGFMAKNGQSIYVQEICAPFHGIMHQKKFGGRPMPGRWRRHPPPSKVVMEVQILFFRSF